MSSPNGKPTAALTHSPTLNIINNAYNNPRKKREELPCKGFICYISEALRALPLICKSIDKIGRMVKKENSKKPEVAKVDALDPAKPKPTKPVKAPVPQKEKHRGFSGDLSEYLALWRNDKANWKFNKVLQAWALESCFTKDLIDKNLFHDLLPYIGTVIGGARERLIERARALIDSEVAESENTTIKRARKIVDKLTLTKEGDKKADSANEA